jgi:hypothetical protein
MADPDEKPEEAALGSFTDSHGACMKLPPRRYLIGLGGLLLLFVVFWSCGGFRAFKPTQLAVGLVRVEADPMHFWPQRFTVMNGITNLCAIFAVTNLSQEDSVWFDTCAVEQNVEGKWVNIPVPPYARRVTDQIRAGRKPWYGIASDEVNQIYLQERVGIMQWRGRRIFPLTRSGICNSATDANPRQKQKKLMMRSG